MLNLDTHLLLHAVAGRLASRERSLLTDAQWSISAIVLWEIAKLAQLGRIVVDLESPRLVAALRRVHIWPVDWEVCRALDELDFHGDPADELIAATSIVHDVPLLTRDRTLRRSKRVPLA